MQTDEAELTPRARAKRDQIRTAAQHLFLRDGFAATSTDALAAEAGVSKQTLYAYYPSKEALLSDVLQNLIGAASRSSFDSRVRMPRNPTELHASLVTIAELTVEQLMQPEYLALFRVIATETPRLPHLSELFRRSVPERVLATVSIFLAEAEAAGLVRLANPDVAARLFVGPLLTFAILGGLLVPEDERKPPTRRQIGDVVDLFLQGALPR